MQQDFTRGSIGKKLVLFSLPIIVGMVLHTAYNIIDTIFVGMLGPMELAAVSLAFPVVFVFIAVASGLGIGANALIAQALGEKKLHRANNLAEHGLMLGITVGIAIAVLGIIFSPAIFTFMGADETVLPLAVDYTNLIFIGLVFMFAWFVSDSILKAQGNSKTPMRNLAISVVLNIALDPLLIFGLGPIPAMGLRGAALATVFSRIVAAALNFSYIYTPKSAVSLSLREFKPHPKYIKQMLVVGLPASASQTLTAAGFMLLMSVVGAFGSLAIAAYGVGMRLSSLAIMPLIGISSAVTSFVGQNIGAKKPGRAKSVSIFATRISFAISLLIAALLLLFPEQVMRVFTQNHAVIAIGVTYLSIVPFAFLLYAFYFSFIGAFQGAGKTHLALATNIAFWLITLPLAWLLSKDMGLEGVWIALVAGAAVELLLVLAIFWSGFWLRSRE